MLVMRAPHAARMTSIAVIGAGTMGHALALVFALGGHRVRLTDSDAATLARAPVLMQAALATLIEGEEAPAGFDAKRLAEQVTCHRDLAATVAGAGIVVEAIVERPAAKRVLFAELDQLLRGGTIIASNTSYLDVFPLIPERRQTFALIAHWYTPPYLVDLVDIVPGPRTDASVIAAMRDLVAGLGKEPVVFEKFVSGYVANRLQSALTLEINRLLDEGVATPEQIDRSIIHGLALRLPVLGHLMKADFTGLKLMQLTLANRTYEPPAATGASATLDLLLAAGRTGAMSGQGYFDWGGRPPEELFRERDRKLITIKQAMRAARSMLDHAVKR
jgi:3-hydroxybutyryl-CoA dehydrogenase